MTNHSDEAPLTGTLPPPTPTPTPTRPGPIPSLDGLRAIAVMIVLVSHAGYGDIVPGGLGVTIFFFLSGYLITTLLVDEEHLQGHIGVRNFYLRRALRLYPSLLVTLAVAYSLMWLDVIGGGFSWGGLLSQLFYFANYHAIFFDSGGSTPEGTGILWSLAVEEHFYILFPVVMLVAFRMRARLQWLAVFFASLCVLALAWRIYLVGGDDFEVLRTYYASDTRFDSILFGCLLAVTVNPARRARSDSSDSMGVRDWALLGAAVALLLASIVPRNDEFRETWRYTLQGISLMPIFYYSIRYSAAFPFRILSNRYLARVGVLSYAIYLVHFVVIAMLQSIFGLGIPTVVLVTLTTVISIVYGEALDRFVEPWFRRRRAMLR